MNWLLAGAIGLGGFIAGCFAKTTLYALLRWLLPSWGGGGN